MIVRFSTVDWGRITPNWDPAGIRTLQRNFSAIVLNGLFFPTAGKILGAGLLLTWFLSELTPSATIVGLLIPIQYGASLLAQPWIGQWMSGRPVSARYYRNQALARTVVWVALGVAVIFLHSRWLLPLSVSPESGLSIFAALFAIAGICYGLGGLTFGAIAESQSMAGPRAGPQEKLLLRVREMLAVVVAAFGMIVFVLGTAGAGIEIATKNFILEIAPDEKRRPVYIGVNDMLTAVPAMLLVIGGAVIDSVGFRPVFLPSARAQPVLHCSWVFAREKRDSSALSYDCVLGSHPTNRTRSHGFRAISG